MSASRDTIRQTNLGNLAVVMFTTKHLAVSKEDFNKLDILLKKQHLIKQMESSREDLVGKEEIKILEVKGKYL